MALNNRQTSIGRKDKQLFRCLFFLFLQFFFLSISAQRQRLSRWGIPPANYSGITPLGGNRYAVVSDDEPMVGFYVWSLSVDSLSGRIIEVRNEGFRGTEWASERDAEGIAFCAQRQTLFVSGETDQRVLEHRLDGSLTGNELQIPSEFSDSAIQPNRGFEALGYDPIRQLFWTCTESPTKKALREDSSSLSLIIQSFSSDLQPFKRFVYHLSHPKSHNRGSDYYHGVVAIAPMEDGTLLVLEREARIAKRGNGSRCWVKLFRFHPESGEKQFVHEWNSRFHLLNTRFANYEGMSLGPVLSDGSATLLLLSDSQAGYGKALWHLKDYIMVYKLPHF